MPRRTTQYHEYLQSLSWHVKRQAALARAGHKCQRCEATKSLEVHHKHYNTLFNEAPEDLEVLCILCHVGADEQRRRKSRREAGLNTWATKKCGEDWQSSGDSDLIVEAFDDWVERRND